MNICACAISWSRILQSIESACTHSMKLSSGAPRDTPPVPPSHVKYAMTRVCGDGEVRPCTHARRSRSDIRVKRSCSPVRPTPASTNKTNNTKDLMSARLRCVDDLYLNQNRCSDLYSFCVVFIPPWGFPSNRSSTFKRQIYLYLSQIDCGDLFSFIWCLYRRDKNKRHRDRNSYIYIN